MPFFAISTILSFSPSPSTSNRSVLTARSTAIPPITPTAVPIGGAKKEPTAAPAAADPAENPRSTAESVTVSCIPSIVGQNSPSTNRLS